MLAATPWHHLYFLPLPQGQGSLRPVMASKVGACCRLHRAHAMSEPGGCRLSRPPAAALLPESLEAGASSSARPPLGCAACYFAGVTGNITCAQGVPFHITKGPPLAGSVERLSSSFGFTGMTITCGPV